MDRFGLKSFSWLGMVGMLALPLHALNTQPPVLPSEDK